ncbi:hypothetical protein BU16DRAFT_589151 [Lophium mytilinum]|uniref:Uncharacterized protein n=1 Tax=Lophium mytilinum TaxID=390894 RepID=A0A6A6QRI4_9PEZI|nr:hypothetical protein BU16DRAFT_589151 [Lophium mytilinum]
MTSQSKKRKRAGGLAEDVSQASNTFGQYRENAPLLKNYGLHTQLADIERLEREAERLDKVMGEYAGMLTSQESVRSRLEGHSDAIRKIAGDELQRQHDKAFADLRTEKDTDIEALKGELAAVKGRGRLYDLLPLLRPRAAILSAPTSRIGSGLIRFARACHCLERLERSPTPSPKTRLRLAPPLASIGLRVAFVLSKSLLVQVGVLSCRNWA